MLGDNWADPHLKKRFDYFMRAFAILLQTLKQYNVKAIDWKEFVETWIVT